MPMPPSQVAAMHHNPTPQIGMVHPMQIPAQQLAHHQQPQHFEERHSINMPRKFRFHWKLLLKLTLKYFQLLLRLTRCPNWLSITLVCTLCLGICQDLALSRLPCPHRPSNTTSTLNLDGLVSRAWWLQLFQMIKTCQDGCPRIILRKVNYCL